MLRYDALGTGRAALVAFNLRSHHANITLDLSALPPQLVGQRPIDLRCPEGCPQQASLSSSHLSVDVGASGYVALVGLQLPRWESRGHYFNCSTTYRVHTGTRPLTSCLIACLRDSHCQGVTVGWVEKHAWPSDHGLAWFGSQVQCQFVGGVDLTQCAEDSAVLPSHTTIMIT